VIQYFRVWYDEIHNKKKGAIKSDRVIKNNDIYIRIKNNNNRRRQGVGRRIIIITINK